MRTDPVMLYEDRSETDCYYLSTWLDDEGKQVYLVVISNAKVFVREKNHDYKRALGILVTARTVIGQYEGEDQEALFAALENVRNVELTE